MSLEVIAIEPIVIDLPPTREDMVCLSRRIATTGYKVREITPADQYVDITPNITTDSYIANAYVKGGTVYTVKKGSVFDNIVVWVQKRRNKMPGNVNITHLPPHIVFMGEKHRNYSIPTLDVGAIPVGYGMNVSHIVRAARGNSAVTQTPSPATNAAH